ncbi:glycosyltransferase family 39 protein [Litorilinea aerophila]|uniref:Glycosyltransferase family 39 protein n=1 Tax=Litorilinea aerophila TaxID=1204385 RepID=A0A540VJ97_9CHLR|nr:glycosyltransferase family 39 protein [Litorilinea aerophila]MCC9075712.1 glycosyltransferase family 39 protein [Litorilinea aerophila]
MIKKTILSYTNWRLVIVPPTLLYLFLVTLYFLTIPLGESPDEPGHLQCIQQVALYNRLPIVEPKPQGEWWKPGVTLSGRMCYHMPLYYVGTGLLQKAIGYMTGSPVAIDFPAHNEAFGETGVMFLHSNRQSLWQREEPSVVIGVRIVSILLGLTVVWASMAIAHQLFPKAPIAALLTGTWVAGWPQFLFLSRAISNDVLATALASITLALLLQPGKPGRYVLLAVLSALAVLTKVTMLFVIGAIVAAWLLEFIRLPQQRRNLIEKFGLMLLIWGATAAIVQLTPTIRTNFWSSAQTFSRVGERVLQLEYWLEVIRLTLSSGWVRFGWMNVAAPDVSAYLWWSLIFGLSFVGCRNWWRSGLRERNLIAAILVVWCLGATAAYIRINMTVFQPQFRFLQSLIPIFSTLVAGGLLSIMPRQPRRQIFVSGTLILLAIVVNALIIWEIVIPHYGLLS